MRHDAGRTLAQSGIEPIAAMLPAYDLAGQILIPGLRRATALRGMFGYFTSGVLVDLAPGLAEYLARHDTDPIRFVVSPAILDQDLEAIRSGATTERSVLEQRMMELLGSTQVTEPALAQHTLECLAWLLACRRLDVKVAFPAYRYHPKVWLLSDSSGTVCARGSGNATGAALHGNVENLDVDCSWVPGSAGKVQTFNDEFEAEWNDESQFMRVFPLSDAVRNEWIYRYKPDDAPGPQDYVVAFRRDVADGLISPPRTLGEVVPRGFRIPPGVKWREGRYAHQGEAIEAFESHGRRGVLEMATGAGKTIAALVAAQRTLEAEGHLLLVIAAPTTPLVLQWAEEAREFGLQPILPTTASRRQEKYAQVDAAIRTLKFRRAKVQCLVVTNNLLTDGLFQEKLKKSDIPSLLVGDEVHNLGVQRFVDSPPEFFTYRLGLSATPVRQYDEPGTAKLFDFFGGVVYRFGLDRAIGMCLVPYDYFVHKVHLDGFELEQWVELTAKIGANQWRAETDEDEYLQRLYRDRRKLVENAASKVPTLKSVLSSVEPRSLSHTLVYTSSKNPRQLVDARGVLRELNLRFHQVTEEESSDRRRLEAVLAQFQEGTLQVLLAKKVLDEGVNLPQVHTAFILASTTVEREWVQRRGRILRQAPGKDHAVIHDFVVLPPPQSEGAADVRALLRAELERMEAFGRLARNATSRDGPVAVASDLVHRYFTDRS